MQRNKRQHKIRTYVGISISVVLPVKVQFCASIFILKDEYSNSINRHKHYGTDTLSTSIHFLSDFVNHPQQRWIQYIILENDGDHGRF
jgi:hypothetical protein